MPKELLPTVITAMCGRLLDRNSNKNEHYALLVSFSILFLYLGTIVVFLTPYMGITTG